MDQQGVYSHIQKDYTILLNPNIQRETHVQYLFYHLTAVRTHRLTITLEHVPVYSNASLHKICSKKQLRNQKCQHTKWRTQKDKDTHTHIHTEIRHLHTEIHSSHCSAGGPLSNHCQLFSSQSVCVFVCVHLRTTHLPLWL